MKQDLFGQMYIHTVDRARNLLDTEGQSLHRRMEHGTALRKHVMHKSRVPFLEID